MRPHRSAAISIALAVLLVAAPAAAQQAADTAAAHLVRISQALMDAVATGDTAVWNRWLAGDGVFTDENGRTRTNAEVIAELGPLPPGYAGHIRVTNPRVAAAGETAVLSYDAMEDLTLHGQRLDTQFHGTDTFVRRGGAWRLIGQQVQVLPAELRPVPVDPAAFDALAGTYELGPGVRYTVAREGARLMGRRGDRAAEELLPLGCDRFFRRGNPRGERFFVRDAAGRVTAMIDRRDNEDLLWAPGPGTVSHPTRHCRDRGPHPLLTPGPIQLA
jgi:hypothetical protein